jgi:hypothetical protein
MIERTLPYLSAGGKHYPAVPVIVHCGSNAHPVEALLDSGSECSIFKIEVARALGIPFEAGERRRVTGVTGESVAFIHEAKVQLFDRRVSVRMVFVEGFQFPFSILGRDFFEKHLITFDERRERVTVTEHERT